METVTLMETFKKENSGATGWFSGKSTGLLIRGSLSSSPTLGIQHTLKKKKGRKNVHALAVLSFPLKYETYCA